MALPVRSQARLLDARANAGGPAASRAAARLRAWLRGRWRSAVRSRVPPAGLRAQLGLSHGELLLAVGYDTEGGCALIATDRAVHHRGAGGWSRHGWELITGVRWDAGGSRLVVTGSGGAAPLETAVPLRECGTLVELAAERITHTRLGSWTVMPDGLDLTDRHARGQVDGALSRLREELGIPRRHSAGPGL